MSDLKKWLSGAGLKEYAPVDEEDFDAATGGAAAKMTKLMAEKGLPAAPAVDVEAQYIAEHPEGPKPKPKPGQPGGPPTAYIDRFGVQRAKRDPTQQSPAAVGLDYEQERDERILAKREEAREEARLKGEAYRAAHPMPEKGGGFLADVVAPPLTRLGRAITEATGLSMDYIGDADFNAGRSARNKDQANRDPFPFVPKARWTDQTPDNDFHALAGPDGPKPEKRLDHLDYLDTSLNMTRKERDERMAAKLARRDALMAAKPLAKQ